MYIVHYLPSLNKNTCNKPYMNILDSHSPHLNEGKQDSCFIRAVNESFGAIMHLKTRLYKCHYTHVHNCSHKWNFTLPLHECCFNKITYIHINNLMLSNVK